MKSNNVRAYRIAITNNGSVYYKVVTFDGQYRGWIYGGKSEANFGGGVSSYSTFNSQGLSPTQAGSTYKISNPGTTNDGKTVTYKSPAWTEYKIGRAVTDTTPYANTLFKIDQVGNRTRENDQWVHITDVNNADSPVNGWILMSGLTQVDSPVADNAIRINLVDPDNSSHIIKSINITRSGAQNGSSFGYDNNGVWTVNKGDQSTIQNQIRSALNGTGYGLEGFSADQLSQIGQTKFGDSVNISVKKITPVADNSVRINFVKPDDSIFLSVDWTKNSASKGSNVGFLLSGNTSWSLDTNDLSTIQAKINTVLGGTAYELNPGSNTLTTSEIDTIAHGQFGGQVYLHVSPVKQQVGAIQPYAYKIEASDQIITNPAQSLLDLFSPSPLTGVDGQYSTTPISVDAPGNKGTFTASAAQVAQNPLLLPTWFAAKGVDADGQAEMTQKVIAAMRTQARKEYISTGVDFSGFTGLPGVSFSGNDIMSYLSKNNANVLHSTKYPLAYTVPGLLVMADQTTYVATSADSGTYGKSAKAYYAYADINLFPSASTSQGK